MFLDDIIGQKQITPFLRAIDGLIADFDCQNVYRLGTRCLCTGPRPSIILVNSRLHTSIFRNQMILPAKCTTFHPCKLDDGEEEMGFQSLPLWIATQ